MLIRRAAELPFADIMSKRIINQITNGRTDLVFDYLATVFTFGPTGARWPLIYSGSHMFRSVHRPNYALQQTAASRSYRNRSA